MARPQHTSQKGVLFIARHEGFRALPYNDVAGNATIGYGHLLHRGPVTDVDRRQWGTTGISNAQALVMLTNDIAAAEAAVRTIEPPFRLQTRFDAIVDFAFNLGGSYLTPQHDIGRALRSRGRRGTAAALREYVRGSDGKRYQGLVNRREDEVRLFLYGRYGK